MKRILRPLAFSLLALCVLTTSVVAQNSKATTTPRKKAPDLLPDTTVLYLQVNDANSLKQKMSDSAFGQMLKDENMRPFVEALYGEATSAFDDVKEQVADVGLDQLFEVPQGEICFGLVALKRDDPAPVFFIDVDPKSETAAKLIERGREFAEGEGAEIETEEVDGLEIHHVNEGGDGVYYFTHEGTYVFSSNREVLEFIWQQWQDTYEGEQKTLSKNRKFITIMNKCRGSNDDPPEIAIFVDPIDMYKAFTRGNAGARLALAFLPTLGLDGLLAVGGSVIYNQQGYDSIFHGHILLSSPRNGIFKMIALKPGMNDPEPFVPDNVISYMTANVSPKTFLDELGQIVDAFNEEGSFEELIDENINAELEIDFREDFIGSLDGRVTWITWAEPPARLNSQSNLLAVKLKDVDKFETVMTKVLDRILTDNPDVIEEHSYEGKKYWGEPDGAAEERMQQLRDRQRQRQEERGQEPGVNMDVRIGSPCFMILDNYFIITESSEFLKKVIKTNKGDGKSLANDEAYGKVIKEMERQLGTQMPSITMFNRPAESMRMLFETAGSDNTKDLLNSGAEQNEYVQRIRDVFEDSPLPDFDKIKHYFPPAGMFVTSDDTGFHLMAFGMKPGKPEEETEEK